MTDRKNFVNAEAKLISQGSVNPVEVVPGVVYAVDRYFSPLQKMQNNVNTKVKAEQELSNIVRNNFLKGSAR